MSIIERQPSSSFPMDLSPDCLDLPSSLQNEWAIFAYDELQLELTSKVRTWGDVTDELIDISQLNDDWDGMGATAPARALVQNCFDLARVSREQCKLPPPDMIRPTPDGNISFEWQTDFGHVEIEVSHDSIEFIYVDPQKEVHYQNSPIKTE